MSPKISDTLQRYVSDQRSAFNADLIDSWKHRGTNWETQIGDSSSPTRCRIQAGWEDDVCDSLEGVPIAFSGWDWSEEKSYFIGIDFDGKSGHEKSANTLTPEQIDEVYDYLSRLHYVEIRRSTSGEGRHVYVRVNGIASKSRGQHKRLGEAILDIMSRDAGFDFNAKKDKVGGMMWFIHAKANETNRSFELLKPATRVLSESDLPSNWRDDPKPAPKTPQATSGGDIDGALKAMRRISMADNKDGSGRLHAYCCRCREHGLNLDQTIAAVRLVAVDKPPPVEWSVSKIGECWNAALKKVEVGAAIGAAPSIRSREGRTDAANAKHFAQSFGKDHLWCDPWKKWMHFDGRRWDEDRTCGIQSAAKQWGQSCWSEIGKIIADPSCSEDNKKALLAYGSYCNSAKGIGAMLSLAKSELAIDPNKFDTDQYAVNFANGTMNLRTGELRPHNKHDYILQLIPIDYDASAACPKFLEYLDSVFDHNRNLIDFMQRYAGYCLTGCVNEQVLTIFQGDGSNGKSIYVNYHLWLLADYATKAPEGLLTAKKFNSHPTEIAKLYRKRFVVATETEHRAEIAEARAKELTGGDRRTARGMCEDFWDYDPTDKICICTNYKPVVHGGHSIWRRLRLVPWLRKYWDPDKGETGPPELKANKKLFEELKAEAPGVLAWMVQGCLEWQRKGLGVPSEVNEATDKYRRTEDRLLDFLSNCSTQQPDATCLVADALSAYVDYTGDEEISQRDFTRLLQAKGFEKQRHRSGPERGKWFWKGFGMSQEPTVSA